MSPTTTPTTTEKRPTAAEARAEHRRLLLADVDHHEAAGLRVPCRWGPLAERFAWTDDALEVQAEAAAACDPCPALEPCRAYGLAHPKEAGVLGGLTERDRAAACRGGERKGEAITRGLPGALKESEVAAR